MTKTATINSRINPDLKRITEEIFSQLGLSTSEAITLFYNQVKLNKGLPFSVSIPNEITEKAIMENEIGDKISYSGLDDLKTEYEEL
jgi:DNA-damage-inducible protein J